MPAEQQEVRKPFVIGQRVRCPHGLNFVVRSEYGGFVDLTGWGISPRVTIPYHTDQVEDVHHGHNKVEWLDDD